MQSRWRIWVMVAVLLGVMAAEMALSAHRESLSWDEGDHLFAGFMSLRTGDLGLNPEHPPLAKMVAALPLVGLPLKVPALQGRFFKDEAYFDGRELLFRNGPANGGQYSADTLIFRARMAVSVFALAMALTVFLAGREMFGVETGLLAMTLVVLEPSLLTHGPFVATDSAVTCLFFATTFLLYRYVSRPSWQRLVATGVVAGLALAAKHSAIVLLPVVVILLAGEIVASPTARLARKGSPILRREALRERVQICFAFVGIAAIAVGVLWAFYGFRYQARPGSLRLDPTLAQYVVDLKPVEAQGILFFARWHLLPESWLYGLADVRKVANFMPTFFLGKVYAHGIWVYFPTVLLIKLTLGSMGLLLLAAWAAVSGRMQKRREIWYLLVPAGVYLLVAMNSQLNIGVRHVLPTLPYLMLFAAAGAWSLVRNARTGLRDRRWAYAVGALVVAHAATSLWAFPNYLPYANEAWGGSGKTYRYLSDSNVDWGQQLKTTSAYLKAHGIKDCWFAYFVSPFIEPADYGIPCRLLPTSDTSAEMDLPVPPVISGVVLMSAGDQNGFELGTKVRNPYQAFMGKQPEAVIDRGMLVYRGTFEVPLAAAIAPTQRSIRLLAKGDTAGAVREAKAAVQVGASSGAGSFDALMQLGKAEAKAGDVAAARDAFGKAAELVHAMEPSAQEQWRPVVAEQVAGLRQ